jgi:hypothetical protein
MAAFNRRRALKQTEEAMTDKSDYDKRTEQVLEDRHEHWLDRPRNHWVRRHLFAGQLFSRERMFEWRRDDDRDCLRWHPIGVDDALLDRESRKHGGPFVRENTSTGREFIEVVEIAATTTVGPIAVYRQWMVGPDGVEVIDLSWVRKRSKVQMRAEHVLRGILNRGEYDEVVEQPRRSKPKLVEAAADH